MAPLALNSGLGANPLRVGKGHSRRDGQSNQEVATNISEVADANGMGVLRNACPEADQEEEAADPERKGEAVLRLRAPKEAENLKELIQFMDAPEVCTATPADWRPGDRVIMSPAMSTDDAKEQLPNVEEVTSYLRYADQP